MERSKIMENLKKYVSRELLEGKDMGLDESTPLLEWGIINSMEIARLITFIQDQFGVEVPDGEIVPEHFLNLASLTNLVLELARGGLTEPTTG